MIFFSFKCAFFQTVRQSVRGMHGEKNTPAIVSVRTASPDALTHFCECGSSERYVQSTPGAISSTPMHRHGHMETLAGLFC